MPYMNKEFFETCLSELCEKLMNLIARNGVFQSSPDFEASAKRELVAILLGKGEPVSPYDKAYVFPDIVVPPFGVEVKFTRNDSWRCVANSVFESTRAQEVEHVYLSVFRPPGVVVPRIGWT